MELGAGADGGQGQAGVRSDVPPRPLCLGPPNTHPHRGLGVSKHEARVCEREARTHRISRVLHVPWGERPGGKCPPLPGETQRRLGSAAQRVWASHTFPLWSPRCRAGWTTGRVLGPG